MHTPQAGDQQHQATIIREHFGGPLVHSENTQTPLFLKPHLHTEKCIPAGKCIRWISRTSAPPRAGLRKAGGELFRCARRDCSRGRWHVPVGGRQEHPAVARADGPEGVAVGARLPVGPPPEGQTSTGLHRKGREGATLRAWQWQSTKAEFLQ